MAHIIWGKVIFHKGVYKIKHFARERDISMHAKNENRTCEFPEASSIARRNEDKTSSVFRAIEEYSGEQNMVYFHFCMQREISLTSKTFYFMGRTICNYV